MLRRRCTASVLAVAVVAAVAGVCLAHRASDGDVSLGATWDDFVQYNVAHTNVEVAAYVSSGLVGLVGLLPLLILPFGQEFAPGSVAERNLRISLGFACGGLLGDVFLHLLPEANERAVKAAGGQAHSHDMSDPHLAVGLWVLAGMLTFLVLEKFALALEGEEEEEEPEPGSAPAASPSPSMSTRSRTRQTAEQTTSGQPRAPGGGGDVKVTAKPPKVAAIGYLAVILNSLDNFTHGMAVSASYCISMKVGMVTTLTVLLHEVPHEICDFAIILKSGMSKRQAFLAQLITSLGSVVGAWAGLSGHDDGAGSGHVLAFVAGGFVYVALVSLSQDLLKPSNQLPWFADIATIGLGIALVGGLAH